MANRARVIKTKKLLYVPPFDLQGNPCWCPVVVKDADSLINWLNGFNYMKYIAESSSDIRFVDLELPLSSNRFDDIMPNGIRFNELTVDEQEEYIQKKNQVKINKITDTEHQSEMGSFNDGAFLHIDCPSCLIPYVFKDANEIPNVNFNCSSCGYLLIQYIGHDDEEYIFNG